MHPIERLRHVARVSGVDAVALTREAAAGLAALADDPAALVPACRRLLDAQPAEGPLWWLAARVLCADDPRAETRRATAELLADTTVERAVELLPQDAAAVVVGWPDVVAAALEARADIAVDVLESGGEGVHLARRLSSSGLDARCVPDAATALAVRACDLVLLEAQALGPGGFIATLGSHAAAAVAHQRATPVWVVAGVGRVLPAALWGAAVALVNGPRAEVDIVPAEIVDTVIGADGSSSFAAAVARPTCPVAPELLGPSHQ